MVNSMEDRYDIGVDVGEGKDWWHIHGLATHDKVYELNKQMCDLGKTILTKNKDIMEEKKTIKEWKEAFAELYKAMRKELGASDLDVNIFQNEVKPVVNFDIKF